jgi:hypothetical protein
MSPLFDLVRFGDISAANRIVVAPLTRNRAGPGRTPTSPMPAGGASPTRFTPEVAASRCNSSMSGKNFRGTSTAGHSVAVMSKSNAHDQSLRLAGLREYYIIIVSPPPWHPCVGSAMDANARLGCLTQ